MLYIREPEGCNQSAPEERAIQRRASVTMGMNAAIQEAASRVSDRRSVRQCLSRFRRRREEVLR